MDSSVRKTLDWLKTESGKHPEILAVHVFGSQARGDALPTSDIDLAAAAASFAAKLDLIYLGEASPGLASKVKNEGKLIYERRKI